MIFNEIIEYKIEKGKFFKFFAKSKSELRKISLKLSIYYWSEVRKGKHDENGGLQRLQA